MSIIKQDFGELGGGEIKELVTFNIIHGTNSNTITVKLIQNEVELSSQTITATGSGATFNSTLIFTTIKNQTLSCNFKNMGTYTIQLIINNETDIQNFTGNNLTYSYNRNIICYV